MASIDRRPGGKWRAQVRREGHVLSKTFVMKADADAWVRETEGRIDRGRRRRVGERGTHASESGRVNVVDSTDVERY